MAMTVCGAVTVLMRVRGAQGGEDGRRAPPGHAESGQELRHRGVIGHQKVVARYGHGEMPVADIEGDANGLVSISWYQSASTATMSPGWSRLPVGRASATSLPPVVITRLRVHRRSSQVRHSVSRCLPANV